MSSRVAHRISWALVALVFLGTLAVYPNLPALMATHWNMSGKVNGTMSTFFGAFVLPFVMLLLLLLFTAIPSIDPLRINIQYFRRQYDMFVALLMLFFVVIQTSILAVNLGATYDQRLVVLPAVGVLMFYVGIVMPQTRRNWFIGIRTPWTISSDRVWQKTHELGGTLFKIFGVVIVLSVFVPTYSIATIVSLLIIIVVGLFAYSYWLYEKELKAA